MKTNKRRQLAAALAVLAVLSGCGGGDGGPTPMTAAADTLALGTGQTGSVLANDTVGGAAARAGAGGNATVSFSGALPQGVTVADGVLGVARGAVPGSYTLAYQLCETAAPSHCATGSVALTVAVPPIAAAADTLSLGVGETASVLTNDQLDGVTAAAATVAVTTAGTWPAGVTLGSDGQLTAGSTAAVGATTLAYRICQIAAPTNCVFAGAGLAGLCPLRDRITCNQHFSALQRRLRGARCCAPASPAPSACPPWQRRQACRATCCRSPAPGR